MPFKSKAQRRKFAQLLVEGKISDETYEEWNRSTGKEVLPERVTPKAAVGKATKRAKKARTAKKAARKAPRKRTAKSGSTTRSRRSG